MKNSIGQRNINKRYCLYHSSTGLKLAIRRKKFLYDLLPPNNFLTSVDETNDFKYFRETLIYESPVELKQGQQMFYEKEYYFVIEQIHLDEENNQQTLYQYLIGK